MAFSVVVHLNQITDFHATTSSALGRIATIVSPVKVLRALTRGAPLCLPEAGRYIFATI
jgi:hypothetical protein